MCSLYAHKFCFGVIMFTMVSNRHFRKKILKELAHNISPVLCLIFKGILSTTIVIFSYPKLLSFSVLTFIKWRLTPSYATKDTICWQKRPKTIIIGIIVQDNKNPNLFIWPSMWTRLEHAHWLDTINNMWFLGKRESVNAWKKADFWRIQREKMNRSEVSSKWNKWRIYVGDQLDRWNELKEVLRVQTRAEVAKILLDR
jgi:hypothetical protein